MGIQLHVVYCIRLDDGADIRRDICVTTSRTHAVKRFRDYVTELNNWMSKYQSEQPITGDWFADRDRLAEFLLKHGLHWMYFDAKPKLLRWDTGQELWIDISKEVWNAEKE